MAFTIEEMRRATYHYIQHRRSLKMRNQVNIIADGNRMMAITDLTKGQLYRPADKNEVYLFCGFSNSKQMHLAVQLTTGERYWFHAGDILRVRPLPKDTVIEITAGE